MNSKQIKKNCSIKIHRLLYKHTVIPETFNLLFQEIKVNILNMIGKWSLK